jgi:hypothetical protein
MHGMRRLQNSRTLKQCYKKEYDNGIFLMDDGRHERIGGELPQ